MCPRLGYWSRGNPRESREYIASREGQREVMRILRPFLSPTFRNLIFRLTRLSMYELTKRYNRWLVITAVTCAGRGLAELSLVSLAVVGRTLLPVWTKFYSRHDHRSFRSTSFRNYYGFYDSPEKKPRPLILCPCGRALIKCRRLRPGDPGLRGKSSGPLACGTKLQKKKPQDFSVPRNIIAWHKGTRSKAGTFANGRGRASLTLLAGRSKSCRRCAR